MTATQKKIGMTDKEANDNYKVEIADGVVTIKIALDVDGEKSSSGKSNVIASTRGNKELRNTEGAKLGLNFYRPL